MDKRKATMLEMKGNAYLYTSALHEALRALPPYPPEDFLEKDLLIMKSYALSIVSKLRFFLTDIKFEQIKKRPDMRDQAILKRMTKPITDNPSREKERQRLLKMEEESK